jgi:hypothetical protein
MKIRNSLSSVVPKLALSAVLTFAFSTAYAGVIPFGTAADLSQFSLNGGASTGFIFGASAGVGGGGGITSTSSSYSSAAAIYLTGSENKVGSSFFVSLDYKMALQGSGPDIRLGFTTATNGNFGGSNDIWIETYGSSTSKSFTRNGFTSGSFSNVTMTPGNWFRETFSLTETAQNSYTGVASVYDLGLTGLVAPTLLTSQSFSFTSSAMASAAKLYPGFFLYSSTTAADNFQASAIPASTVPEPGTLALTVPLLVGIGLIRRRRRAKASN